MAELGPLMSTHSDRSDENSHQRLHAVDPPAALVTDDQEPAGPEPGWPGVVPPAAWFLRLPTGRLAEAALPDSPGPSPEPGGPDDPAEEWFIAPDDAESPISWSEPLDDPQPRHDPELLDDARPPNDAGPPADAGLPNDDSPLDWPEAGPRPAAASPVSSAPPPAPVSYLRRQPELPVVGPTRALKGRPGGPGFQPAPSVKPNAGRLTSWQAAYRQWTEAGIPWDEPPAAEPDPAARPDFADGPATDRARPADAWPELARPQRARPQRPSFVPRPRSPEPASFEPPASEPAAPEPRSAEPPTAPRPVITPMPLGAPVYAAPPPASSGNVDAGGVGPADVGAGGRRTPGAAPPLWTTAEAGPEGFASRYGDDPADPGTLLLEPGPPGRWRPRTRPRRPGRRLTTVLVPVIVLVAVAVLALGLLTGHGPKAAPSSANQGPNAASRAAAAAPTIGMYPGQPQRGVFQTVNRIVSSGATIVAMGSQASDGVVRQQFFVSADGGASWRLAPTQAPGGGQAALGYPAARLAGGPGGWLAVGPQATWTSGTGLTWTLAATHGITPMVSGDDMWVLNSTSTGFLAAGVAAAPGHAAQAVIWTSRDGLTWQRMTAAQLGLAGPGETVQSISYLTSRGPDTLMAGQVTKAGASYAGVWLSTDGGSTWTRVTVPADHGAGRSIAGLAADGSGLLAVRPGRSASGTGDGVAYFSPDGTSWQYAGTVGASQDWTASLVKGGDHGFVVAGTSAAGQLVGYTAAGTGMTWAPTGSLGPASGESVVGAAVASAGTIVAVGYTARGQVSQQPVFLEASGAGQVRPVSLASLPGGSIPELAVNGLAVAAGQQIAVGSSEGYPAVWRGTATGSWALVTSLAQVSGGSGLAALTGVTHGSAGWLAVGAPGPVVMTSADGSAWASQAGPGSISADLAGVAAVATAAGAHGYVIVGKLVAAGGACVADVWWSPDLKSWTRAHDVNEVTGSSQVLAVAAGASGFVSAGSHNGKPAVWITSDGTTWTTVVLPVPSGASAGVLQQVAVSGNRVVAVGQATTPAGVVPLAELSLDGGITWQQVPLASPGPDATFTALTVGAAGFTAAAQFGPPGQQQIAAWTSAAGTAWTPVKIGGAARSQQGGSYQVSALAASGPSVIAIGSVATQSGHDVFTVTQPAR